MGKRLHNLTKGKIGECFAIGMFLKNGFQVYTVEADLYGVDFLAIHEDGTKILKIQVKSITSKNKGFRIKKNQEPIDYYFFVNTDNYEFWIIPYNKVNEEVEKIKIKNNLKDIILKYDSNFLRNFKEFSTLNPPQPKFRSDRIGKFGEKLAVSKLLKNGYLVYDCVVDNKGIDLIATNKAKIYKVQVKYSSKRNFRNIKHTKADNNTKFLLITDNGKGFYFCDSKRIIKMTSKKGSLYLNNTKLNQLTKNMLK